MSTNDANDTSSDGPPRPPAWRRRHWDFIPVSAKYVEDGVYLVAVPTLSEYPDGSRTVGRAHLEVDVLPDDFEAGEPAGRGPDPARAAGLTFALTPDDWPNTLWLAESFVLGNWGPPDEAGAAGAPGAPVPELSGAERAAVLAAHPAPARGGAGPRRGWARPERRVAGGRGARQRRHARRRPRKLTRRDVATLWRYLAYGPTAGGEGDRQRDLEALQDLAEKLAALLPSDGA
jgi:hypothetical protein